MSTVIYNVLLPIYAGFNTLDVGGPLDVLCNVAGRYSDGSSRFNITIAAKDLDGPNSKAYEFLTARPDITFQTAIEGIQKGKFDILLVPGGNSAAVEVAKNLPSPNIVDVCKQFLAHDNASGLDKWMMSVCVGALIMAESRCFAGLNATTHYLALDKLKDITIGTKGPAIVTRERWIDGGIAEPVGNTKVPTRVLSAGGISCSLDAALYLVKTLFGVQIAVDTAAVMDYMWNPGLEKPMTPAAKWQNAEYPNVSSVYTTVQQPIKNEITESEC